MSAHTPEPWPEAADHPSYFPFATQRDPIRMECDDYERARACVNACAGMDDPAADIAKLRRDLEANIESRHMEGVAFRKCIAQRDALAEALRAFADWYDERNGDGECRPLENARAALATLDKQKA